MATTGLDRKLRIWDVRNYKQLCAYTLPFGLAEVSFSQRYVIACSVGNQIQIFNDAHLGTTTAPYMSHQCTGIVCSLQFCPYEDVLGVGHQHGFTSLLVPGSGEPNFNALLTNPYESRTQRREREVKQLLDKIQPELITLDTTEIVQVNTDLLEKENERLKLLLHTKPREVKFKPGNKKKGRGSAVRKEQIKQGVQSEQRFVINEARKKLEEEFLAKETMKVEDSQKTVLDSVCCLYCLFLLKFEFADEGHCFVLEDLACEILKKKSDERVDFKLPKDLTQAKRLGLVLSKYKDKHYYTVLFGISTVYIMLQSLAIPGSIFLTVLSGYLFPFPIALCLVCTVSHGVAPPSCIYIQAGATLQKLTHVGAAWSWNAILLVAFTALLSLVPIFYKRINKNDGIFNKSKNIKNS
ncbi:unnamed protein product [Wuchereria bancrofti]|uniref:BING4 C-terminal domain-containing protein n=1 Tax=Wuchereria bancrofti TaxID=6293 RepID=A0A3P7FQ03_WUCBA|nr:unnamed protein product [Wuchereria bancrofti]